MRQPPQWAEDFDGVAWFWPPEGQAWDEFLTGMYGRAELWEYCIPFRGETGEGGYAIVRDGVVEDTYMLLLS
jgi:hypothetical protein